MRKITVLRYIIPIVWLTFTYLPVYWLLLTSFRKSLSAVGEAIAFAPHVGFTWDNYVSIFFGYEPLGIAPIWKSLTNSLVISFGACGLALLYGVPAAYVVSRYKTGGTFMSSLFLGFRMFPPIVILIPFLAVYVTIGLFDTHIGMILFYGLVNSPFALWLMKSFFDDIPKDVDQAAILDGCSLFKVFYKIALPMAKSGLITTLVFIFILIWNDFIGVLVLTQNLAYTLPFYLGKVKLSFAGTLYGVIGAVSFVSLIPVLVLTRYLQRHLVRGLTFGAVKGR